MNFKFFELPFTTSKPLHQNESAAKYQRSLEIIHKSHSTESKSQRDATKKTAINNNNNSENIYERLYRSKINCSSTSLHEKRNRLTTRQPPNERENYVSLSIIDLNDKMSSRDRFKHLLLTRTFSTTTNDLNSRLDKLDFLQSPVSFKKKSATKKA